jgi:hypothetical protein
MPNSFQVFGGSAPLADQEAQVKSLLNALCLEAFGKVQKFF